MTVSLMALAKNKNFKIPSINLSLHKEERGFGTLRVTVDSLAVFHIADS